MKTKTEKSEHLFVCRTRVLLDAGRVAEAMEYVERKQRAVARQLDAVEQATALLPKDNPPPTIVINNGVRVV